MSEQKHDFRVLARGIGTVLDFDKDDFVFREGDPPRYMYVVLKGAVEVATKGKIIETVNEGAGAWDARAD